MIMNSDKVDTKEMKRIHFQVPPTRTATCPTCGKHSTFTFHGEQRWPEKVAKAMNLPEVIVVWQCDTCDTTLLEPNLNFDK